MSRREREEELEVLRLRDDIGHDANIRQLIRMCYLAVGDEYMFARRVDLLRRQLPRAVKDSEEFQQRLDECTVIEEVWEYRYNCGIKMGTPEKPVMVNDPNDFDYDPKKPTYPISPIKVEKSWTDWMAVFELCVDELEKRGTTWTKEEGGAAT